MLLLALADWGPIERSISAGRFREALAQLERVSERPAAWHLLASKAHDGLNDPARAVMEAEAAIAQEPGSEAAHVQLGFIFLSRNTSLAAVEIFTDAERQFPNSLIVRLGKGLAQKELQLYDEAEATLARCWPHPLAFDAQATVLVQRAKFGQAKELSARFIQVNPGDYRGYYFLASAKNGLQEEGVRDALAQSLARKGDFAAAHALLGKLQLRAGEYADAVGSLEKAARYRPDLVQAHLHLAQAYRKLGREEDAMREFGVVADLRKQEAQPKPSLMYHRGSKP
ncbi:MAG TPA: tetratricopeptide repeat protein [Bryobacteraceae bacterium]|nr:tetratricopeptide repeat protein [Bryobacteraceae bacterium]